jgi:transposase InsO family protein
MQQLSLPKSFYFVSRNQPIELSAAAAERLRWLKAWQRLRAEGYSSQRAAELLKQPRATLYRWQKRVDEQGLRGLEERSRRPKRCRRPEWTPELAEAVLAYREEYGWDKVKLAKLLKDEGWQTSASTVGRIMVRLKARGVLREPLRNGIRQYKKRRLRRPHATRKPKGYAIRRPGDLVQVDTLDLRPMPGEVVKQFTARDMVSRWDVIEAYSRITARNARSFLETLLARSPYPVRAIQVDGGSEFQAEFEQACAEKQIQLFVLPPRSPKLNGHVERAQRTHTEEFHDRYMGDLELRKLNRAMREWEHVYNHIRPHYSLDLQTPAEYLASHFPEMTPIPKPSHMS